MSVVRDLGEKKNLLVIPSKPLCFHTKTHQTSVICRKCKKSGLKLLILGLQIAKFSRGKVPPDPPFRDFDYKKE